MERKQAKSGAKDYGVNKGTHRMIIKQVFKNDSMTKRDLINAIPNVNRRSIERELSKLRSMGVVLTVDSSSGGTHSNTTVVSVYYMFTEAFVDYGELSPKQVEKWSSLLARYDSTVRRFLTKANSRSDDIVSVKSKLSNLLDSVSVSSPSEAELRNRVRDLLELNTDIIFEKFGADRSPSRNRPALNQRRSLRQPKAAKRSLRASQAAIQEGACRELPGGWLQRGRRAIQKVREGIYRRVGEVIGSV